MLQSMSLEILQKCSRTFDCRYIWRHFCKIHFATNKTQNQHQVFSEKLFFVDLRAMFYFEHIQNEFVVYDMYNPSILPNTKLVKRRICHFFKQPIRVQCNFIHQSDHFFLQCLNRCSSDLFGLCQNRLPSKQLSNYSPYFFFICSCVI